MSLEEVLKQRNLPKEVGAKFVEISESVLRANLGREPEPAELGAMAEQMISELLSGGYLLIREKGAGAQEAESWLRKTLAMAAASVRMRGSEALIKIDVTIRDLPNKMPRPDPARQVKKDPEAANEIETP